MSCNDSIHDEECECTPEAVLRKLRRIEAQSKELKEEVEELRVRDRIAYGPRVPESSIVVHEIYGPSDYKYSVGSGGSGSQD